MPSPFLQRPFLRTEILGRLRVVERGEMTMLEHELGLVALREHDRTGFCPLCEAGPPPHHNEKCRLGDVVRHSRPEGDA